MRACLIAFALVLNMAAASVRAADDWPQFRGPDGQGRADSTGLPLEWSETKNVAWKVGIPGKGWSSPVIQAGQVWMTTSLDQGRSLRAVCVDQRTGELIHDVEVFRPESPPPVNDKNSYASPTPVLESGRVWVHFGTFGTACLDTASGQVLWRNTELVLDHKEGPGSSPILCGDLLLVNCDGIDAQYVAALDKRSGQVVWKVNRSRAMNDNPDFRKAYSTPLVIDTGGRRQAISIGADWVFAYDPATGDELWTVHYSGFSNVPRPLFGHGLVYVCTGYMRPQLWAIRADGTGDVTATHVAWQCEKQVPANPSPLLVGDELYMVSDQGVATCLDALSGREHWQKRLGGNYSASPVFADGRIYFFSEEGKATVIRPGRRYKALADNALDGRILASPAVAGRALFVRSERHLYRIEDAVGAPVP